jgi:hypothetical protein
VRLLRHVHPGVPSVANSVANDCGITVAKHFDASALESA